MNQMNKNSKSGFRNFLISIVFSLLTFITLFFLLSYLLFRVPNFDDYYGFFPIVLLVLQGVITVLYCRRFRERSVYFTLLSTVAVSVCSLLVGFFCFGLFSSFAKIIAMHSVFIFASAALQLVIQRKQPVKRKKMPFKT